MRATPAILDDQGVRRAVACLDMLPIRPTVARALHDARPEAPPPDAAELDPAWALARSRSGSAPPVDASGLLEELPWWLSVGVSAAGLAALTRLWRHSAAVALAARRLAREAGDPDPDAAARAGLLHHLGLWALAAVDPGRLAEWMAAPPAARPDLERRWLGTDSRAAGRRLAERWGAGPLVVDATWLHDDAGGDLLDCAAEPARLALVRRAYDLARRTPWGIDPAPARGLVAAEPIDRLLTAEVQARCGGPFVAPDASPREEALTRDVVRLRRELARAEAERDRLGRALDAAAAGHRGRVAADEAVRDRDRLGALAEFAAGAGHELNNPLAVIVGRAQLLLGRGPDAEGGRSLRAIIAQAQRAARILRDLMYVARPPEPRPRACQPDDVVRASLRDLQAEAEARGVRLVHEPRQPAPAVWADPEPLRQVADELARNALEASDRGASVRFATAGNGRAVRWTVHDSGRGIGPAEGAHLFDPFFCGRQAGRGLGLGLPRVARFVEQAGGELRWRSTPGHGSTFQVTLPVAEIPAPPPSPSPEPAAQAAES